MDSVDLIFVIPASEMVSFQNVIPSSEACVEQLGLYSVNQLLVHIV